MKCPVIKEKSSDWFNWELTVHGFCYEPICSNVGGFLLECGGDVINGVTLIIEFPADTSQSEAIQYATSLCLVAREVYAKGKHDGEISKANHIKSAFKEIS